MFIKIIIPLIIISILIFLWLKHRQLHNFSNEISKEWFDIRILFQERNDCIINMINTIKDFAKNETIIFEEAIGSINRFRAAVASADLNKANLIEKQLLSSIEALINLEALYPEIGGSDVFKDYRQQINNVNKLLKKATDSYNSLVANYNNTIKEFPFIITSKIFKLKPMKFYRVEYSIMEDSIKST
ncbi:LemA family protein [Alkaliphilus pronyensis]|uniref:LemA family protein n=1 Tax=Alkaliphilus pronyensis TaxID=1482732 RepID=A0A6I0F681_9FIRM|nr:LemA family protein [Alkaliphilus pronyensis]KAB3532445.1 LemA family protein [Alkaliphilus pronyensis]